MLLTLVQLQLLNAVGRIVRHKLRHDRHGAPVLSTCLFQSLRWGLGVHFVELHRNNHLGHDALLGLALMRLRMRRAHADNS